jgi:hypothetical protein
MHSIEWRGEQQYPPKVDPELSINGGTRALNSIVWFEEHDTGGTPWAVPENYKKWSPSSIQSWVCGYGHGKGTTPESAPSIALVNQIRRG